MGWTASDDPFAQIRLRFPTLAAAVAHAERQGLDYRVIEPPVRRSPRERYQETLPRGLGCPHLKVAFDGKEVQL